MIITVVDGQGGGMGAAVIKQLRSAFGNEPEICALGTNSIATSKMMKAGANRGATGEAAIVRSAPEADIIIGPLAVILSHAMMGELTPKMAEAICSSRAKKILIPLTQENVQIVGVRTEPLPHMVERALEIIKKEGTHV